MGVYIEGLSLCLICEFVPSLRGHIGVNIGVLSWVGEPESVGGGRSKVQYQDCTVSFFDFF